MRDNLSKTLNLIRPKYVFFLFLVLAMVMIVSALIELNQSKRELTDLMREQAHTLSENILIASRNSLLSNIVVENLIEERLLNNANIIRQYYNQGRVNNHFLEQFALDNDLYRINIFNAKGIKIFSSHRQEHFDRSTDQEPEDILSPIFSGRQDTLIIGLKASRFDQGSRYAVAVAGRNRAAIVVNLDAADLLNFRREIGFGSLLRDVIHNAGVVYAVLQDTNGILAASGNVQEMEKINTSPFLSQAMQDSLFQTRITQFDSVKVLEAVHPFYMQGEPMGLLRIGLSLQPMDAINSRIYRRIIIISLVLLVIGFILLTLLLVRQNLDFSHKQYQTVETYSQNIIQHVNDAILVYDRQNGIRVFNKMAEKLFGIGVKDALGKNLASVFLSSACKNIETENFSLQEVECRLGNRNRYLLVSKNHYSDTDGSLATILVIRDLTEQKRLEVQIERRERMSALGQLASGVAHEIRNPLNAIGTVIQQLNRDFKPASHEQEYHDLAGLVHQEVKRINDTISNFLKFARPELMQPEEFDLDKFFSELHTGYASLADEKKVELKINNQWHGSVKWDRGKMKQVLMNLIQNAFEAMDEGGKINVLVVSKPDQQLELKISDTGKGIPEEIRKKIFNLYFTTKAKGTGVGLSIVQQIVDQHGGVISVESELGKGTTFSIIMPVTCE
jgi:two-component system sensor histidine kinase HydH